MKAAVAMGQEQRARLEADAAEAIGHLACCPFFDGKRVVITGATGMLGGWVAYLLAQMKTFTGHGPEVIRILRSGDSPTRPIWRELIPEHQVTFWAPGDPDPRVPDADLYLHLASPASASEFLRTPAATVDLNIRGTSALLSSAARIPGSRLLFVSSSEIYGMAEGLLSESTPGVVPLDSRRWIYAESKRLGELLCRIHSENRDVHTVIVRPFHCFGPGMRPDESRIFGDFIYAILRGNSLIVRSDPATSRTFCYAPEAATAFLLALACGESGEVFNVAGQAPTAIGALAESLTREHLPAGSSVQYLESGHPGNANPVRESTADTGRIRALGWSPHINTLDAFRRTIAFLQAGDNDLQEHRH